MRLLFMKRQGRFLAFFVFKEMVTTIMNFIDLYILLKKNHGKTTEKPQLHIENNASKTGVK
jgi:ABC-type maltose transport system permease subunit